MRRVTTKERAAPGFSTRSNHVARMAERLAEEQAALRRVAKLVARQVPTEEVFAAVTAEVGRLLDTHLAGMARYEGDNALTVLSTWADEGEFGGAHPLVPGPWPLEGGDLASMIWRSGRPVRIVDYRGVPGRIAEFVRDELGIGSSLGSPIIVDGRLWGALFVHAKQIDEPLPRETGLRLTGFTQQRLVSIGLALRHAQHELGPSANGTAATLEGALAELTLAIEEVRQLTRGVRPVTPGPPLTTELRCAS